MKIPKYIENLLDRRAKIAYDLDDIDYKLTQWINKNEIDVDPADYCNGVEIYEAPYESVERIKEAIRNK